MQKIDHQSKFDMVLLSVRRLLKRGAVANLTNLLRRLHPADVARVIVHLDTPQERRTAFDLVEGIAEQGQVVSELSKEMIPQVLEDSNAADIAWMLRFVPADDVAYILGVLPEERSQEILPLMKDEESQEVVNLMAYPKGTAGSIMTTEFFLSSRRHDWRKRRLKLCSKILRQRLFFISMPQIKLEN